MSMLVTSSGGSVDEAILIGDYIRKNHIDVVVQDECFSSCVFLQAANIQRKNLSPYSKIGIHRPYFGSANPTATVAKIRQSRTLTIRRLKAKMVDWDVNPTLIDDMLSIAPEKIKILSDDELTDYRLNVNDANFDESYVALVATINGLSPTEFRSRRGLADSQCVTKWPNGKVVHPSAFCSVLIIKNMTYDELTALPSIDGCGEFSDYQGYSFGADGPFIKWWDCVFSKRNISYASMEISYRTSLLSRAWRHPLRTSQTFP